MRYSKYSKQRLARGETIYLKVTQAVLAELFGVSKSCVKAWIYWGKIDPSSLLDIVEKYNNRHLLDGRRMRKIKRLLAEQEQSTATHLNSKETCNDSEA